MLSTLKINTIITAQLITVKMFKKLIKMLLKHYLNSIITNNEQKIRKKKVLKFKNSTKKSKNSKDQEVEKKKVKIVILI